MGRHLGGGGVGGSGGAPPQTPFWTRPCRTLADLFSGLCLESSGATFPTVCLTQNLFKWEQDILMCHEHFTTIIYRRFLFPAPRYSTCCRSHPSIFEVPLRCPTFLRQGGRHDLFTVRAKSAHCYEENSLAGHQQTSDCHATLTLMSKK